MSPGVSIRTSLLPSSSRRKCCAGASLRFDEMVRYTEWASEGLAHHFAFEGDELRLKRTFAVVRYRRVSPIAPPPREGPLTEPTRDAQPWRRERVLTAVPRRYRVFWERSLYRTDSGHSPWQRERLFVPHWHSRPLWRTRQGARQREPRPGRSKIASHANTARCQPCELRATLSFLGQYVPRSGSSEPGPT
jgi:hypothetical protein